jgi:large subunit ribosomal protein L22
MKRIRPAPMGRAYRYVRRIAHLEIVLAERNKNGAPVAHGAGEETKTAAPAKPKAKAKPKRKAVARKTAGKK